MAPTPEQIADVLEVAAMGGDLERLSEVCLDQAGRYDAAGRQRLLDAAEVLAWGAKLVAAMEASPATETAGAAGRG